MEPDSAQSSVFTPGTSAGDTSSNRSSAERIKSMREAVALNQLYQSLIAKNIEDCAQFLEENRCQQNVLAEALKDIQCDNRSVPLPTYKVPTAPFMPPYFRDAAAMYPPWCLEDIRVKQEYGVFNPLDEPPVRWNDSDKARVKSSIAEMAMQQRITPLAHRKSLLMEKLLTQQQIQSAAVAPGKPTGADDTTHDGSIGGGPVSKRRRRSRKGGRSKDSSGDGEEESAAEPSISTGEQADLGLEDKSQDEGDAEQQIECKIKKIKVEIGEKEKEIYRISNQIPQNDLIRSLNPEDIDWMKISNFDLANKRSVIECEQLWMNELHPDVNASPYWETKEVTKLNSLVDAYGGDRQAIDWDAVAEELGTGRSAYLCYEKYHENVPTLMHQKAWSVEEDALLCKVVEHCRNGQYIPWPQVAYFMDGRHMTQVYQRYVRQHQPRGKKGQWGVDEDIRLLSAVNKFGGSSWLKIAEMVGTRNEVQCRDRWRNVLDGNIVHTPWSHEEDARIRLGMEVFGELFPSKIAYLLPGRTGAQVKRRIEYIKSDGNLRQPSITKCQARPFASSQMYWQNKVGDEYPLISGPNSSSGQTDQFLYTLPDNVRFEIFEKLADIRANLFAENLMDQMVTDPAKRKKRKKRFVHMNGRPQSTFTRPNNDSFLCRTYRVNVYDVDVMKELQRQLWTSHSVQRLRFITEFYESKLGLRQFENGEKVGSSKDVPGLLAMPGMSNVDGLRKFLFHQMYFDPRSEVMNARSGEKKVVLASLMGPPQLQSGGGTKGFKHTGKSGKSQSGKVNGLKRAAATSLCVPQKLSAKRVRNSLSAHPERLPQVVRRSPNFNLLHERIRSVFLWPILLQTNSEIWDGFSTPTAPPENSHAENAVEIIENGVDEAEQEEERDNVISNGVEVDATYAAFTDVSPRPTSGQTTTLQTVNG